MELWIQVYRGYVTFAHVVEDVGGHWLGLWYAEIDGRWFLCLPPHGEVELVGSMHVEWAELEKAGLCKAQIRGRDGKLRSGGGSR